MESFEAGSACLGLFSDVQRRSDMSVGLQHGIWLTEPPLRWDVVMFGAWVPQPVLRLPVPMNSSDSMTSMTSPAPGTWRSKRPSDDLHLKLYPGNPKTLCRALGFQARVHQCCVTLVGFLGSAGWTSEGCRYVTTAETQMCCRRLRCWKISG